MCRRLLKWTTLASSSCQRPEGLPRFVGEIAFLFSKSRDRLPSSLTHFHFTGPLTDRNHRSLKKNKKSKTGGRIPHSFHWFTRRKGKPPSTYFCMVISHIVNGWEGFFTRIRQVEENPESRHQPWQGVGVVESGIVGKSSIRPVGERFVHLDQWTSGR